MDANDDGNILRIKWAQGDAIFNGNTWGEIILGNLISPEPECDFDGSGVCDIDDLDELLYTGLVTGDAKYDLDGSGTVDLDDRDTFLNELSTVPGDFDLNGQVVAGDLNTLGGNWRKDGLTSYGQGDADGDGVADAADLNALGRNWQFGANAAVMASVPEPSGSLMVFIGLFSLFAQRKIMHRLRVQFYGFPAT